MIDTDLGILVILAFAIYRIAHFIIEDFLFEPVREWVWSRFPPETTKTGYLFTCYWCLGFWISLFVIGLYLILPVPTLIGAAVLALSAVVGLIDHWKSK